jgi:5-deoxy-glucuronate isomerase
MQWVYKKGELAKEGWDVVVDDSLPGWKHTGLRICTLSGFANSVPVELNIPADDKERVLFALEGEGLVISYRLKGQESFEKQNLIGRTSVFAGPTDHLYLPMQTEVIIEGKGRVAVVEASARDIKPVKLIAASEVPVFVRGAGRESRQVNNFGVPDQLDASRLIVCEVIVPSGNWSGIPPHKHDTFVAGVESNLEEIYYFEASPAKGSAPLQSDPTGYLRVYASDERPIDVAAEVRSGDVGLVPYGWHGPVAATPGSDLYFLNVMAGPDPDRSWNITDDPNYAWIRDSWRHQDQDPRLPYTKGN